MRVKENYFPLISLAFFLTIAILVLFQLHILNEPGRIAAVMAHDNAVAVNAGQTIFQNNCTLCHGDSGQGTRGRPALNDKHFLGTTNDDVIFSVISSGVPNTEMPAWNQSHGGPLTDEDIQNVVAFLRSWQATAPDRSSVPPEGDLTKGRSEYASVCAVCHGDNGQGSAQGAALNDSVKLNEFADSWYRDVINNGRPAKGMPTWGTVLSPQQVSDIIAVIDYWRRNSSAVPTPAATTESGAEIARPSNSGGAGPAVNLIGDPQSGLQLFVANCQKCHGTNGLGGVANPGSDDGTVPPLNPIDETLISTDPQTYAYNLDLFIEHGSTPAGTNPQQSMPAWGDEGKLKPQQIADLIAYVMSLNPAPAATATTVPEAAVQATAEATAQATAAPEAAATTEGGEEIARPSNSGGSGQAVSLTGNSQSGAQLFVANCQKCHGANGVGGIANPGSDDGTVPPLNPIDETLMSTNPQTYAYNLDLFIEHGSTPAGTNPQQSMPAWGDEGKLKPQQIADLIAYVMSLNPAPEATVAPASP